MAKRVLAFDFGASSGRAIIGHFDGENIRLEEVHRFSNDPVSVNGTLYWDVLRLFFEIKQGLTKAKLAGGFDSIGIDTWGVDFGLLDEFGCLLENPVHYRDARTKGMIDEVFKTVPREAVHSLRRDGYESAAAHYSDKLVGAAYISLCVHVTPPTVPAASPPDPL